MKTKSTLRSFLALAGSSLIAMSSANAQSTYTWANSNITAAPPASLNWFNATQGSWTGGTPVSSNLNTIQFFQDTTTALTNTGASGNTQTSVIDTPLDAAFQLGTLTLNGLASATTGANLTMNISGDPLNFSAATGTINLNALNATRTITYNLDSNIQLGTASSAGALTLTGNGTSTFNIGGVISELQTGGGSLTKSGTSTVSLNNANTYTGRTTISQGVLLLNHATALPGGIGSTGGTSNLSFNGTGTNLTVLGLGNGNFARPLGANTVTGAVTFTGNGGWAAYGADRTVNLGGTGAQITWATADTGFNAKSLILGAGNATHTVTLENALDLGSSARTVITQDGSAAIDGKLSGNIIGTAGGLTKTGTGTLALSGTNTYSGKTTVGAGFPSPAQLIFQGKQAVSPNTTFETQQSSGSNARLVFLDDSAGLISLNNSWRFQSDGGPGTKVTGIFVGNNSTANGGNNPSSTQAGSTIALGGYTASWTGGVNGSPVSQINITGANGYKLQLASIAFPDLSSREVGRSYTISLNPTTAPVIVTGGVTPFASTNLNNTPVINLDGTATGNEIQDAIADPSNVGTSNPLRLTKNNSSTWTLSGNNTYSGSTTISSGTLAVTNIDVVTNNNALGKSSAAAANLILRGGTLQYTTGGSASTDRNFALVSSSTIDASGAGALNFSQTGDVSPDVTGLTGTTMAASAVITGLGSTANLVVGMAVNMTGVPAGRTIASIDSATQITLNSGTSVTAGTNSSAFGYGSRTLTLTGTNTGANTIAGNLVNSTAGSGVLSVTKSGAGTWVLSGANTYTGGSTISTGTLVFRNTAAKSASGTHAFAGGTTLGLGVGGTGDFNSTDITSAFAGGVMSANLTNVTVTATTNVAIDTTAGNFTHSADITGSPTKGLTKLGANTLTLGGSNTYTGATLVSAGTLLVNGSLGNSAVTVNSCAFGGSGTIGGTLGLNAGTSFHVVNLLDALAVAGTVTIYAGFGVDDLAGLTWGSVGDGTYTLINGTLGAGVFAGLANNSAGTAFDLGGGRSAYFTESSLNLVVQTIPEPSAALLGGIGFLCLLRRRR